MTSDESNVTEHLYKVLVIGDFGVGKVSFKLLTAPGVLCDMDFLLETHKMDEADVLVELPTSIIRRYTEGTFSPNYKLTIGVDFCLKSLNWNKNTKVNLQLWDIAGHERFGHMTRVYYKYAIAAIIMFDLSRPATFDSVIKWSEDVNQKVMLANEQPIPVLLLANKCDLEDVSINDRALNEFCAKQNFLGWFSTSAKDNVNIDEAMHFLVENILQLNNQNVQPDGDHISLHQDREYFEVIEEDRTPLSKLKDQCCR